VPVNLGILTSRALCTMLALYLRRRNSWPCGSSNFIPGYLCVWLITYTSIVVLQVALELRPYLTSKIATNKYSFQCKLYQILFKHG